MRLELDPDLAAALERRRREWQRLDGTARFRARDASLWTGSGEESWLGWLDVERLSSVDLTGADGVASAVPAADLAAHLAGPPFRRCLLLGMGGSALGAELLWRSLLPAGTSAEFVVLDTTDPREVERALAGVEPADLRVIAASKSGGTLETRYGFELLLDFLGSAARDRTLAVTDRGSALEDRARAVGARVAFGQPDIGGRFSVLSAFGLAPAAVAGIDPTALLSSARSMAGACRSRGAEDEAPNPGVELGLLLAAAHDCGRDKLHLRAPSTVGPMVAWVEQLLAESLGKGDVLLLPVDARGGPPGPVPGRLDILLGFDVPKSGFRREGAAVNSAVGGDSPAGKTVDSGRRDGDATDSAVVPRVAIPAELPADLGGELFRWQFATAVAGALLGVNPFDQPDVESSKAVTRRYVQRMKTGSVAAPSGVVRLSEVSALGLEQILGTHLATLPERGYAVVSAWLDRGGGHGELLEALRRRIGERTGASAVLGYGPSYLHSTGQAHKGGPNRGLFLLLTAEPPVAGPMVPGEGVSFGQVQLAQAWGDHDVLVERRRCALALHLDGGAEAGLRRLVAALG